MLHRQIPYHSLSLKQRAPQWRVKISADNPLKSLALALEKYHEPAWGYLQRRLEEYPHE